MLRIPDGCVVYYSSRYEYDDLSIYISKDANMSWLKKHNHDTIVSDEYNIIKVSKTIIIMSHYPYLHVVKETNGVLNKSLLWSILSCRKLFRSNVTALVRDFGHCYFKSENDSLKAKLVL